MLIEGRVQWPKYITPSVQWRMDEVCIFLLIENVQFLRLQVAIELNYHLDLNCRGIYKNHDPPPPWSWEIREDAVLLLPGKNKNLTSTFLNPLS